MSDESELRKYMGAFFAYGDPDGDNWLVVHRRVGGPDCVHSHTINCWCEPIIIDRATYLGPKQAASAVMRQSRKN